MERLLGNHNSFDKTYTLAYIMEDRKETVKAKGLTLVTNNVSEFEGVRGIKVMNWAEG